MTLQQSPYLRQQRQFQYDEIKPISVELDRMYIDIAQKVNVRTIGIFAKDNAIITGENWFLQGSTQVLQTLRKMFKFTAAGSYAHGINVPVSSGFTRIYGTFTDGTNWYPLPYVSTVAVANQVSIQVTPTQIVITAGGAAPAITLMYVVLEYLS
jgi:hypothetical protein